MAKKVEKKEKVAKKVEEEVKEFVVTEEYLNEHPELIADGVTVGDTIAVDDKPKAVEPAEEVKKPVKKIDLDEEVAILKGEEFIRVYPEGNEENVKGFLSKDDKYVAVKPSDMLSITVSWRENEKRKDEDTGRIVDTGRLLTQTNMFSAKDGEDWMMKARILANEGPRRSCVVILKK
jgi:hypothetical protein